MKHGILTTENAAPEASLRGSKLRRFLAFGPGVVFVLCAVGPSDLVSGSVAGSAYGYSLLWLLIVALFARFLILDATARYVMVSGESLLAGFGRISKWILLLWFLVVLLKRHLSGLVKLVLLGTASHIVLPLPTPHSAAIWGLSWWVFGFVLMYWGRYGVIEKLSKPLAFLLGACLAAAAIMSKPAPVDLLTGALTPVIPTEGGLYSPVVVLMTVMSATASFSNLKYSAFVHEKGWRTASFLRGQRMDLLMSMGSLFFMLAMIQIAAAGLLKPRGIEVGAIEDLIPIFSEVLGDGGRIVLGVTLWALAFSNYLGSTTSYGIMISDVYYRFIRRDPKIAERNQAPPVRCQPTAGWCSMSSSPRSTSSFSRTGPRSGCCSCRMRRACCRYPLIVLAVLRLTADKKIMGGPRQWLVYQCRAHANDYRCGLSRIQRGG